MSDELRDLADYFGDDGWEWADGEPFDGAGAVARVKRRLGGAEAERDRLREALRALADEETWTRVLALGVDAKTVAATVGIAARQALTEGGNE